MVWTSDDAASSCLTRPFFPRVWGIILYFAHQLHSVQPWVNHNVLDKESKGIGKKQEQGICTWMKREHLNCLKLGYTEWRLLCVVLRRGLAPGVKLPFPPLPSSSSSSLLACLELCEDRLCSVRLNVHPWTTCHACVAPILGRIIYGYRTGL